jgi:hypothetical protein
MIEEVDLEAALSAPVQTTFEFLELYRIASSFNGRTADSDSAYWGSNPCEATKTHFISVHPRIYLCENPLIFNNLAQILVHRRSFVFTPSHSLWRYIWRYTRCISKEGLEVQSSIPPYGHGNQDDQAGVGAG